MRTYRATLRIRLQEETAHDAEVQLNRFVRLLETFPGIIAEIGETDYDFSRENNDPSNLQVVTNAEHQLIHRAE